MPSLDCSSWQQVTLARLRWCTSAGLTPTQLPCPASCSLPRTPSHKHLHTLCCVVNNAASVWQCRELQEKWKRCRSERNKSHNRVSAHFCEQNLSRCPSGHVVRCRGAWFEPEVQPEEERNGMLLKCFYLFQSELLRWGWWPRGLPWLLKEQLPPEGTGCWHNVGLNSADVCKRRKM